MCVLKNPTGHFVHMQSPSLYSFFKAQRKWSYGALGFTCSELGAEVC